jgi:FlaA1/EpsC-like NDP-sugar epimerase
MSIGGDFLALPGNQRAILGRDHYEEDDFSSVFGGHTVLITGGGGSIGSALARRISDHQPQRVVVLDRDEFALHTLQLALHGSGTLDAPDLVLCDFRDSRAVWKVFETIRPSIVVHAGALKHVPLLERFPGEAWATNVLGTRNVLQSSLEVGTRLFVNISTDKAAAPANALGASKLLAERMTAWAGRFSGHRYLSVRFGNVLGTRGSVIDTFVHQATNRLNLEVSHPQATRYFLSLDEACALVLHACSLGGPADVMVMDMGESFSIDVLARRIVALLGSPSNIVYTGLRPGDKLHEVIFNHNETLLPTGHSRINRTTVEELAPFDLETHLQLFRSTSASHWRQAIQGP